MKNHKLIEQVLASITTNIGARAQYSEQDLEQLFLYTCGELSTDEREKVEDRISMDREYRVLANVIKYEVLRSYPRNWGFRISFSLSQRLNSIIRWLTNLYSSLGSNWIYVAPTVVAASLILIFLALPGEPVIDEQNYEFISLIDNGQRGTTPTNKNIVLPHSVDYDNGFLKFRWTRSNPNSSHFKVFISNQDFETTSTDISVEMNVVHGDSLKIEVEEYVNSTLISLQRIYYIVQD